MANTQRTKQTATAARPTAPEDQAGADDGVHVVEEGETLDAIAESTGVSAARLQRLNGIKRPDLIWSGMTLRTGR
ncbi:MULTISPECIES: LysM peptidoglycan-binding domain-containing protein [unclassified Microbacterium]|uniref:LysM peptidoglycan-binding domain-containing protein n=1 Tax=unclassified Microbacterium TaxID=2609290 RepID=UPI0036698773